MKTVKTGTLALCGLFAAAPALAGPRDDVLYGAVRCAAITDDHAWLDCYYGAAQPMRSRLGLSPAPAAQQKLVPAAAAGLPSPSFQQSAVVSAPPPSRVEKMGFFESLATHQVDKPAPAVAMASYVFDAAGYFTVTLVNGQVWKQNAGDSSLAHWRGPAKNMTAAIMPGPRDVHVMKTGNGELYEVMQIR